MIVINKIPEKQNDINMLAIQYCARHCYNFAEYLNYASWVICIITVIILSLPAVSSFLGEWKIIIALFFNILAIVVDCLYKRFIKTGATLKMLFDYKLFGFDEKDKYNGLSIPEIKHIVAKIINRYPKSFKKQSENNGESKIKGVKDWYYNIPSALPLDKAVRKCQEQNKLFDICLTKNTLILYVILLIVVFIWFIVVNANMSVAGIFINLCSAFALIKKIVSEFYSIGKLSVTNDFTFQLITNKSIDSMVIQSIIDERRLVNVTIPNFLHKLMSNKLHATISTADSIDI